MQESLLRLFKGYFGAQTSDISKEALKYGILLTGSANQEVIDAAIKLYGKDGEKWNQTFHKSLAKVKDASIEELVFEQIIHYITTYGFEELGIYSSETVYIPGEKLDIPELDDENIELIVINPLSEKEIRIRIMDLATSGIALSEETKQDILALGLFIGKNRVEEIKNKELKIALYHKYGIVPKDPEDFLRYLIIELTNQTLKIKNDFLYKEIKVSDKKKAYKLLKQYLKDEEAYNSLASIFYRNKKLFLALKVSSYEKYGKDKEHAVNINKYINKIRKLADANHKPLQKDVVDLLTQDIDIKNEKEEILKGLEKVNIFREVRILNGITYRMLGSNDIVYKVRNGKSYAKKLQDKTPEYLKKLQIRYDIVKGHLIERVSKIVKNKKVYIPENVSYTVPTSEKQFNGNYPDGSYIEIPRESDLIYGIHWTNALVNGVEDDTFIPSEENLPFDEIEEDSFLMSDMESDVDEEEFEEDTDEYRIDLDIKQMNKTEVFGWDYDYKTENGDIIFTGDVTDAPLPNGATELFYVSKNYGPNAFLITVNEYTRYGQNFKKDLPYEFVIAKAEPNANIDDCRNYIINPNDIVEKINLSIPKDSSQVIVGLITIGDSIRLYLSDMGQGSSMTSKRDEKSMITLDYIMSYNRIQLRLKDLLKEAGAILTETKDDVEIDLSINSITKDSLISLLTENKSK